MKYMRMGMGMGMETAGGNSVEWSVFILGREDVSCMVLWSGERIRA